MDLDQIETFLAVVAARSFSKAAKRLNTTQPNVSLRIAALERELGKRLLDRSNREVTPTPEGRAFAVYAERMSLLREQARMAVADPETLAAVVRLGVSETIVHDWLPEFIRRVNQTYPRVELELTVDTTPHLRDLLVTRELDMGFLLGPVAEPNLHNRHLCTYELIWVASPVLDLPDGLLGLEALCAFPIITYPRRTRPTIALSRRLQKLGKSGSRLIASGSLATNHKLALAGVGVAPLPAFMVRDDVAAGRLRILQVDADAELDPLPFTVTFPALGVTALIEAVSGIAVACADE